MHQSEKLKFSTELRAQKNKLPKGLCDLLTLLMICKEPLEGKKFFKRQQKRFCVSLLKKRSTYLPLKRTSISSFTSVVIAKVLANDFL